MKPLYVLVATLVLANLILPVVSKVQAKEAPELPWRSNLASTDSASLTFCPKIQVSRTGAVCTSPYGLTARLDFPAVDVGSVLAGEQFFPNTEAAFSAPDQVIEGVQYRNITFILRWESTTPDYLQVYLEDILPDWDGKGIPYRLLWRARYETCAAKSCESWAEIKKRGEYLPREIPDLAEDLAADSNFNGVPVSFWNTNLRVR